MRCCSRLSFANLWIVIYGLGIVWHEQPLIVIPAIFAAIVAHGVASWARYSSREFGAAAPRVHQAIVAIVLVAAIAGVAAASTSVAASWTSDSLHRRDTPLAVFFLIVAILAWRALVRPSPWRTVRIASFVYITWLPFVVLNALGKLGDAPRATDWQHVTTSIALWTVVGAGGLVCWVATLVSADSDLPIARLRR